MFLIDRIKEALKAEPWLDVSGLVTAMDYNGTRHALRQTMNNNGTNIGELRRAAITEHWERKNDKAK